MEMDAQEVACLFLEGGWYTRLQLLDGPGANLMGRLPQGGALLSRE